MFNEYRNKRVMYGVDMMVDFGAIDTVTNLYYITTEPKASSSWVLSE